MMVYEIILEYEYPSEIWDFRKSHSLSMKEAKKILLSFPFQEPQEYLQDWGDQPEPQILYGNLAKGLMLIIGYAGKDVYNITLIKNEKLILHSLNKNIIESLEVIEAFWSEKANFSVLSRKISSSLDIWREIKYLGRKIFPH